MPCKPGSERLGLNSFAENKTYFSGLLETRPYMGARTELAQLLCGAGRAEDAIRHFEALLELRPNDNQGVRDILLGRYLLCDKLTGAQRLLHDCRENATAIFVWGRTLKRFCPVI